MGGSYNDQGSYVGGWATHNDDVRRAEEQEEELCGGHDWEEINKEWVAGKWFFEYKCRKCGKMK